MCKHVAAVLYGVGARLDQQPELLFTPAPGRCPRTSSPRPAPACRKSKAGPAAGKVLADSELADVFGIEMAERAPTPAATERKSQSVKTPGTTPQAKTQGRRIIGREASCREAQEAGQEIANSGTGKTSDREAAGPASRRVPQDRWQDCESQGGGRGRGSRGETACVDQGGSQAVMSSPRAVELPRPQGLVWTEKRPLSSGALGLAISWANSMACAQMATFASPETIGITPVARADLTVVAGQPLQPRPR